MAACQPLIFVFCSSYQQDSFFKKEHRKTAGISPGGDDSIFSKP